jgi:hypothetical protein
MRAINREKRMTNEDANELYSIMRHTEGLARRRTSDLEHHRSTNVTSNKENAKSVFASILQSKENT